MKIFIISLKSATKRREIAKTQLSKTNLSYEFFDAVQGVSDAINAFSEINSWKFRLNSLREPLPEEIGCYASHRALWRKSVILNEPIVILEDDFKLNPLFAQTISEVGEHINTFGFIRLESSKRNSSVLKRLRPRTYNVLNLRNHSLQYLSDPPQSMTAYAISPKAAKTLLTVSKIFTAPVDKFVQRTWEHATPIFVLEPAVVEASEIRANNNSTINIAGGRSRKSRNPMLLLSRMIYKGFGEVQRIRFDRKQIHRLGLSSFSQTK
ncbi:MAG: glycosyltransferase family 25 protein [Gammaproteobacteria bacterium]|nr:glycosyltransferase family 25 protein [Gammaproteobacteria bacterium]